MTRRRGERGQAGGEVLALGFLVLLAGTLLLANAWAVVDTRMAVSAAAREAARGYVEADDETAATRSAIARAEQTLDAFGRRSTAMVHPPVVPAGFGRCARVEMVVDAVVPALVIPFIDGFESGIAVSATHTEVVDPFRDGLTGPATC